MANSETSTFIPSDPRVSATEMMQAWQGPRRGRDAIDTMLTLLSPWELIYLRTKARAITVEATEGNGFATCESLPPEILVCITQYLTPYDLLRLRQVSQGWRLCWMNSDVLNPVFRRFYPGIRQASALSHEKLLIRTKTHYRRKRTRDWVGGFIPLDASESPHRPSSGGPFTEQLFLGSYWRYIHRPGPYPFFNEGKVAWQPFNGQVVVDDLQTGRRIRCCREVDPRRRQGWNLLVAITGKMVVLASSVLPMNNDSDNFRLLYIFHLEEQKEWERVTLPAGLAHCYAQKEQLVATCLGGQVISYTWRGQSTEVPTFSEPQSQPCHTKRLFGGVPGVLFHPISSDLLFLVWVCSHTPTYPSNDLEDFEPSPHSLWTTVVVKYKHDQLDHQWRPVARYSSSISYPRLGTRRELNEVDSFSFKLSCDKVNYHGSYSIGFCRATYDPTCTHDHPHEWWGPMKGLFQCFNVLTTSFDYKICSSLPPMFPCPKRDVIPPDLSCYSEVTKRVRLWNSEVFHIQSFNTRQDGVASYDMTHGIPEDDDTIALVIASDPILFGTKEHHANSDPGRRWSFMDWAEHPTIATGSPQLFIDDDYMVLFTQHGYLVRAFHGSTSWLSTQEGPNFTTTDLANQFQRTINLDYVPLLRTWAGEASTMPTGR